MGVVVILLAGGVDSRTPVPISEVSTGLGSTSSSQATCDSSMVNHHSMISPIESLSVEVFETIVSDLDLPAYQQLRLASRQLHLLSLAPFAKRYFSDITTTLGSPSLNRLVNLSQHGYFCEVVTLLDIKILTHRDYKLLKNIQEVGIYPPPKRFAILTGIRQEHITGEATLYDDTMGQQYPQCITGRLTCALKGFPNLKRIRFRAHHHEPIGWQDIAMPEGDQVFRENCFQAVLNAIIKSGIQVETFSTAKMKRNAILKKCANLAYPALDLPFSSLPSLRHAFANLQTLVLAIVSARDGDSRVPGWENNMCHFVACAPNLKSLTLSLDRKGLVSYNSRAIIRSLALSCRLERLETLHLINCSLYEADLVKFLLAHAESLTSVSLSYVRLLKWNWETFWTSLQVLKVLRYVRIAQPEELRSPVAFRLRDTNKSRIVLDAEKQGRSMQALLDELVAAVRGEIGGVEHEYNEPA